LKERGAGWGGRTRLLARGITQGLAKMGKVGGGKHI